MSRHYVLKLKVELFLGTTIEEAAEEMIALANKLDVLVEAEFNELILWAYPNDIPSELVAAYREKLAKPLSLAYRIVRATKIVKNLAL